jgi:hypothetical protein
VAAGALAGGGRRRRKWYSLAGRRGAEEVRVRGRATRGRSGGQGGCERGEGAQGRLIRCAGGEGAQSECARGRAID